MKKIGLLITFCSLFLLASAGYCSFLGVDDYLKMVEDKNTGLKAINLNIEAIKSKIVEADRVYSPEFNASFNYMNDESQRPYSAAAPLDEISGPSYDLNLYKEFQTGTNVTVGYSYSELKNKFGTPLVPGYTVTDMYPYIKLEQSLIKQFNGGSTKAGIAKLKAQAKAQLYLLLYQKQQIMLNATVTYWNLSYTRTLVDYRKTSLTRNETILKWNEKRYALDLVNKVDLLQSQAAYKQREYNLKLANEQKIEASRNFNRLLDLTSSEVSYDVEVFFNKSNKNVSGSSIEKLGRRADVLSSQADVESTMYAAEESNKGIGSELKLLGSFALNGVDKSMSGASDHVWDADRPSYTIGATYNLPLDFSTRKTVNKGYEYAYTAAQKNAESIDIAEKNDWDQLNDSWKYAKERFKLSLEIREIQNQRNIESKIMLTKGRTTTYEALQSEQDLDDSTLGVLQNLLELITLYERNRILYSTVEQF